MCACVSMQSENLLLEYGYVGEDVCVSAYAKRICGILSGPDKNMNIIYVGVCVIIQA